MAQWTHNPATNEAQCLDCGFTTIIASNEHIPAHICRNKHVRPCDCKYRVGFLRTVGCPSCGGDQYKLKVFACYLHGECSDIPKIKGVRGCQHCLDIESTAGRGVPEGPAYKPILRMNQ